METSSLRNGEEVTSIDPLFRVSSRRSTRRSNKGGWVLRTFFAGFVFLVLIGTILQVVYFHHELPFAVPLPGALLESHPEWKIDREGAALPTITTTARKNGSIQKTREQLDRRNKAAPLLETKARRTTKNDSTEASATRFSNSTIEENPLLKLFRHAGVQIEDIPQEDLDRLPAVWNVLQSLYGDLQEPVILGMETCEHYRNTVPKQQRYTGVAGLFNTGTNAMEFHLRKNLQLASKWQVPWGKHRVAAVRLNHTAPGMMDKSKQAIVKEHALPVIMLRDPLFWMQSMCKSPYAAKWKHTKMHCPNLVPTEHDIKRFGKELKVTNNNFNVSVYFDKNQIMHWDSLAHLYSDWYNQYVTTADYPRIFVRFEDMLLQAPAVMQKIAECTGAETPEQFTYQVNSAKAHGSHTNFVKAVLKSGDEKARLQSLTADDLEYAAQHLDKDLLEKMHYTLPTKPPPSGQN